MTRAPAFPRCWRVCGTTSPRATWRKGNSALRRSPGCSATRKPALSPGPSGAGPERPPATSAVAGAPSRKEAVKAGLDLRLDRLGSAQNRACLEEVEHAEDTDVRPQHEVRRTFLEPVLNDGVPHHGDRGHQAVPRIESAAGLFGAAGHVD